MNRPKSEMTDSHTDSDQSDSDSERTSIHTVPARVDLPVQIVQRAREIARQSDNPEKRVGDYLDEACLLDITYYTNGEPVDIEQDN